MGGGRPCTRRRPLTLADQLDLYAAQPPVPADAERERWGEPGRQVGGGSAEQTGRSLPCPRTPTIAPPASGPPPPPPGRGRGSSRNTWPGAHSGPSHPGTCGQGSHSRPRARSPAGSGCQAQTASGRSADRWSGCTGRPVTWGRSPGPCLQRGGARVRRGSPQLPSPKASPEPCVRPGRLPS